MNSWTSVVALVALVTQSDLPASKDAAPEPFARSMWFGVAITVLEDLDGDGKLEFMVADPGAIHLGESRGAVVTYDGRTLRPRNIEWGVVDGACVGLAETRSASSVSTVPATEPHAGAPAVPARGGARTNTVRVRRASAVSVALTTIGSQPCSILSGVDFDRDGVDDVLVAQPHARTEEQLERQRRDGTYDRDGRVELLSGRTGLPIATKTPDTAIRHFGASVAVLDDLDGDGTRDVAVSSASHIAFHSGASLSHLENMPAVSSGRWDGAALWGARDCDRDGKIDLLIGCSEVEDSRVVRLWSVAKSRELWHDELPGLPANSRRVLRFDLVQLEDVDGDGVDDVAYAVDDPESRPTYPSTVRALSGASGKVLWSTTFQEPLIDFLGLRLRAWSDHNGDGHGDLLLGKREWRYGAEETSAPGSVSVLDGVTGKVLAQVR